MGLSIQSVFRDLKPLQLALDTGAKVLEKDNVFYVPSPCDASQLLKITDSEFVGQDIRCEFLAGGLFDYLADTLGGYEQAVDHVLKNYPQMAAQLPSGSIQDYRDNFVQELQQQREQFRKILDLRKNWKDSETSFTSAHLWFSSREIDVRHVGYLCFPAKGAQLLDVLSFLDISPNTECLVYPYFSDYHTIAKLEIQNLSRPDRLQEVWLNPSKRSFFGLHSCLGDAGLIRVYPDFLTLLQRCSAKSNLSNCWHGSVSVAFNPDADAQGLRFDSAAVVSDQHDFTEFSKVRCVAKRFFVSSESAHALLSPERITPWNEYALRFLDRLIVEDRRYSPKIAQFIQNIKSDQELCRFTLAWLEKSNVSEKFMRQARAQMDTREIYRSGNLQILSSKHGYSARRINSSIETPFTNFQLRVDNTVWFPDNEELFCAGRVLVGEGEYPIMFPWGLASRPSELEMTAISAVRRFSKSSNPPLPMITDSTLKRHLHAIVVQQVSAKPQIDGIRKLGWNKSKTIFTAPSWQADITGVKPTSRIAYPGVSYFERHYSFAGFKSSDFALSSSSAHSLIALCVSLLLRSYRGDFLPCVRLLDRADLTPLLRAVFSAFGQNHAVEAGLSRRPPVKVSVDNDSFSGFPMYVVLPNDTTPELIDYPYLILGQSGLSLDGPDDVEFLRNVSALAGHVFQTCLVQALRDRGADFVKYSEAPTVQDLIREGRAAIEHYTKLKSFPIVDDAFPVFNEFLGTVPFEALAQRFRFDLNQQAVVLNCGRADLSHELVTAGLASIQNMPEPCLAINPTWLHSTLSDFYGRPVTLYYTTPPPPENSPSGQSSRALVTH